MLNLLVILLLALLPVTLKKHGELELSEIEKWKLGWRMVISSMEKDYDLGERQFDSLLTSKAKIKKEFILTGLRILKERNKSEKFNQITKGLNSETLEFLCDKNVIDKTSAEFEYCLTFSHEVSKPELQSELIRMYINDQVARGGNMDEVLSKYHLKKEEVVKIKDAISIDEENRTKLKELLNSYGFPTKRMVGNEAMHGIFIIIQHSDEDKIWQKSQLPNIEKAVRNGDMDGQSYAYLYDRIKINSGEKQLYGTQFAKVDFKNKIAELADTEDLDNLDKRRMEIGMMPIETYKLFMLKYAQE